MRNSFFFRLHREVGHTNILELLDYLSASQKNNSFYFYNEESWKCNMVDRIIQDNLFNNYYLFKFTINLL